MPWDLANVAYVLFFLSLIIDWNIISPGCCSRILLIAVCSFIPWKIRTVWSYMAFFVTPKTCIDFASSLTSLTSLASLASSIYRTISSCDPSKVLILLFSHHHIFEEPMISQLNSHLLQPFLLLFPKLLIYRDYRIKCFKCGIFSGYFSFCNLVHLNLNVPPHFALREFYIQLLICDDKGGSQISRFEGILSLLSIRTALNGFDMLVDSTVCPDLIFIHHVNQIAF